MAQSTQRRLAAIVLMDVVGYSRLMGEDEEGTLSKLRLCKTEIIEPLIAEYGGRIVKTMGDGLLLEYPSVVAGVESATKIQQRISTSNNSSEASSPIQFRVGIHIGDVIVEGDDIFGDGVNVAARIEPLADSGGVSLSDEAYRMVHNRLKLTWRDGGIHELKNIAQKARIWHWTPAGKKNYSPNQKINTRAELPVTPSIAVMPFDNISGNSEQDYFANGLTEDLVTDLSKISGLLVIASSSTFAVRDQDLNVQQSAERLGVRHLLKGNVRKAGDRVRINAQLIDAINGSNIWAERFDGPLKDVFELQDDVSAKVVAALSVRLTCAEDVRLQQVHTKNMDAYEIYVRAKATPFPPVPQRINAARELFQQVIELDPNFAGGYAGVSWMITFSAMLGHGDIAEKLALGEEMANRALEVDNTFGWSHVATALAHLLAGRHDDANASLDKAIELSPSDADAHSFKGFAAAVAGRPKEGAKHMQRALRLNPQFIMGPYLNLLCLFGVLARDYDAAVSAYEKNFERQGPLGPPVLSWAAAAYYKIGNIEATKSVVGLLTEQFPKFRLRGWNFFEIIKSPDARQEIYEVIQAAGVPE